MPTFSFVTTCKGRLDHLRQTLPSMATQPDAECIVVDYACPDGTADWVQANFPEVRIVRVADAPLFRKAHAQNLGAAAARAPWLCLVDADVTVGAEFCARLEPLLQRGCYLRPDQLSPGAYGSFVCAREDFEAAEGFDETFEGCSYMDDDLYVRLEMAGVREVHFPGDLFVAIRHDDDLRTRHYEIKDRALNHRINFLYANIKHDLMRQFQGKNVPLATRRTIYAEVRRVVLAQATNKDAGAKLDVDLPGFSSVPERYGWEIRRRWSFDFMQFKP